MPAASRAEAVFGRACGSPGWERALWHSSSSASHTALSSRTFWHSLQDTVPVVAVRSTRLMLDEPQLSQRVVCGIVSCGCRGQGSTRWDRSTWMYASQPLQSLNALLLNAVVATTTRKLEADSCLLGCSSGSRGALEQRNRLDQETQ